jgi:CrcB protein
VTFLWICLAGALGTGARHLLTVALTAACGTALPWGTLAVNLIGSFLLGGLVQASASAGSISPEVRLTLGTGFLGGFTTYSAFNQQTLDLAQHDAWGRAALYVVTTLAGCLVAGAAGALAGRRLAAG